VGAVRKFTLVLLAYIHIYGYPAPAAA